MEGKLLYWYQWWETIEENQYWETFKEALLNRFQLAVLQKPFEMLLALKQTESVQEYREQFELYMALLSDRDPTYLGSIFLNGLRKDIKMALKLYPSATLKDAMRSAQSVDESERVKEEEEETAGKEETSGSAQEEIPTEEGVGQCKSLQLSFYSMKGFTTRKSMKMWVEIKGRKVIVLIDCGASHNFVSKVLVEELGLLVLETDPYTVEVGDGRRLR